MDQNQTIAAQYGVNGTPTVFFYNKGQLVDKLVGALPKSELQRHLDSLLSRS